MQIGTGGPFTLDERGEYHLQTTRPLVFGDRSNIYRITDGEIRVNDTVTARFSEQPRPRTTVAVRGIGKFRYEEDILSLTALAPCSFFLKRVG